MAADIVETALHSTTSGPKTCCLLTALSNSATLQDFMKGKSWMITTDTQDPDTPRQNRLSVLQFPIQKYHAFARHRLLPNTLIQSATFPGPLERK